MLIKTKICKKCGKDLMLTEEFWYKSKTTKSGFGSPCRQCKIKKNAEGYAANKEKIKITQAKYREAHREDINKRMVEYSKTNKDTIAVKYHQWYLHNKDKVRKRGATYRAKHPDKLQIKGKKQYAKHKEHIIAQRLLPADFILYGHRLSQEENATNTQGTVSVTCAYCGKTFIPTGIQVRCRIMALNDQISGEQRLYCSPGCKESCPIFGQIKWPKKFKAATAREANPLLRQLVLKRDNYTCQKCGATDAPLHCHHTVPARQNPMTANDPSACITYCKACHKEVHKQPGCTPHALKC